jgi:hypothetical protein
MLTDRRVGGLTRLSTFGIVGARETPSPPLRRSFVPEGPLGTIICPSEALKSILRAPAGPPSVLAPG